MKPNDRQIDAGFAAALEYTERMAPERAIDWSAAEPEQVATARGWVSAVLEAAMGRHKLPERRHVVTQEIRWKGVHRFHVSAGYDPNTGQLLEVFYATGMKEGTDLRNAAQDACVLISIALQYGATIGELSKTMGEQPDFDGTATPASIIGAIVNHLHKCEAE